MTKEQARKIFTQKRLALSEGEFQHNNRAICENFFANVDISFLSVLHTFLPIEKKREVNVWLIIDRIRREFPQVRISIPRVNSETSEIESFYFEGLHQLKTNAWGIDEPVQGIPTPPEKISIVLVPLLAADRAGNRVGYGRGFYDKFLGSIHHDVKKIGLSFFPPIDRIDDVEAFNVKVDAMITPAEFLSFS